MVVTHRVIGCPHEEGIDYLGAFCLLAVAATYPGFDERNCITLNVSQA